MEAGSVEVNKKGRTCGVGLGAVLGARWGVIGQSTKVRGGAGGQVTALGKKGFDSFLDCEAGSMSDCPP